MWDLAVVLEDNQRIMSGDLAEARQPVGYEHGAIARRGHELRSKARPGCMRASHDVREKHRPDAARGDPAGHEEQLQRPLFGRPFHQSQADFTIGTVAIFELGDEEQMLRRSAKRISTRFGKYNL